MAQAPQRPAIARLPSHRTKVSVLFRDVCDRLRHYVTLLSPGMELTEVGLSRELGISRTPVREALIQLSNEGLVQFRHNGRCHVAELSEQDVLEMSQIRAALEGMAAAILAPKITPEQLDELRQLAIAADNLQQDHVDQEQADEAFHLRFLRFAGNVRVCELLYQHGMLERMVRIPRPMPGQPAIVMSPIKHGHLVDALAAGDPEHCERIFRGHVYSAKLFASGGEL